MSNYVRYAGEVNRGPSPIIFGDIAKCFHDQWEGKALIVYDDFATPTLHDSASVQGGYYTYEDTGVVIAGSAGPPVLSGVAHGLGELEISGNDADNDEGHVQFGYGGMFRLDNGSGNTGKVMFECRVKKASIANDALGFFLGLATGPVAGDYLVDNTAALKADRGFIGFACFLDDGDKADVVYQGASQTMQTVLANAVTLAANTYVKLGFIYNPFELDASKKIKFYVNSVDIGYYVNTTQIDTATFPEGETLQPVWLTKVGAAAESKTQLDWICAVQYADQQA